MAKTLVIVESPAKARTLERFLGDQYQVKASFGHVRDLPDSAAKCPTRSRRRSGAGSASIPTATSRPTTSCPSDKRKNVQDLKAAMKTASAVMLATDPDREGESISWHLHAGAQAENSGQAHRLSRNHQEGDRSGRQGRARRRRQPGARPGKPPHPGPSLRIHPVAGVVEESADGAQRRPRAERGGPADCRPGGRAAGVPAGAILRISTPSLLPTDGTFAGTLARIGDVRVATGKDFDAQGVLVNKAYACCPTRTRPRWSNRSTATCRGRSRVWRPNPASSVRRRPSPRPRSRRKRVASSGSPRERTMQAAQRLFQDGHISYHRTDSTTLSDEGARRVGQRHPGDVRRRILLRSAPIRDEGQERAGGARGHPPDEFHQRGRRTRERDRRETTCASTS